MNALRLRIRNIAITLIGVSTISLSGCSSLRAPAAPTTPFLIHADLLHPWQEHSPWDLVWSSSPGHIMVKSQYPRKIYVAPIDTTYLNKKKNDKGVWVSERTLSDDDVKNVTDALRASFISQIKSHPETNLQIADDPGTGVIIVALSLTELVPTSIAINAAADVGGLLIPGSKAIEDVGSVGAQAATGSLAGGSVAMEMKIIDSTTGQVLAEAQDREADPSSILPNYRDFEEFGWSRQTADQWAKQFREVFSTSATTAVDNQALLSVTPW